MERKEAIHKVYGMSGTAEQHEALEFLVPEIRELRESYEREKEDEKIRRELIASVECNKDLTQGRKEQIYAYIERQKEQKPYEPKNWPADKDNLTQEQKRVERIEDSIKFEEGFKTGRELGLRDGQKYVLNNLDSYGLCRFAEWSEEDETNWQNYIKQLELQYNKCPNVVLWDDINWLKSVHNKFKSLRFQPHWKPSKEQMKELALAAEEVGGKRGEILIQIFEQLKKL